MLSNDNKYTIGVSLIFALLMLTVHIQQRNKNQENSNEVYHQSLTHHFNDGDIYNPTFKDIKNELTSAANSFLKQHEVTYLPSLTTYFEGHANGHILHVHDPQEANLLIMRMMEHFAKIPTHTERNTYSYDDKRFYLENGELFVEPM